MNLFKRKNRAELEVKQEVGLYSPRVTLRSSSQTLSEDEIKSMLKSRGYFDSSWNKSKSFRNDFASRTIGGDSVVVDRATGLMWQQSGSEKLINFSDAESWVSNLNRKGYAGYGDWRLPTLEEAASLLESSKMNGDLYIDPVFSGIQEFIWTGDKYDAGSGWFVSFFGGQVDGLNFDGINYVRPVRRDR